MDFALEAGLRSEGEVLAGFAALGCLQESPFCLPDVDSVNAIFEKTSKGWLDESSETYHFSSSIPADEHFGPVADIRVVGDDDLSDVFWRLRGHSHKPVELERAIGAQPVGLEACLHQHRAVRAVLRLQPSFRPTHESIPVREYLVAAATEGIVAVAVWVVVPKVKGRRVSKCLEAGVRVSMSQSAAWCLILFLRTLPPIN